MHRQNYVHCVLSNTNVHPLVVALLNSRYLLFCTLWEKKVLVSLKHLNLNTTT